MSLSIRLFGTPLIETEGTPISVDTRKAIALLAYCLVDGNRLSRETLAALLWEENNRTSARASLRRTLSTLKKALDSPALRIERQALTFEPGAGDWIDLYEFEQTLDEVEAHRHEPGNHCEPCLQRLERACALYRDHFMSGFGLRDSVAFDSWQTTQSEYYLRRLTWALAALVQGLAARHDYERAIHHALRWLDVDPLHEEAHRLLMRLYALKGERSSALQQYRRCVRILEEELGVPPLPETTELYQQIQAGSLQPAPPTRHPDARTLTVDSALAPPHPPFAGRRDVLRLLRGAYARSRTRRQLCAIEGEQGIGKTRLIEEFAQRELEGRARHIVVRCYESDVSLAYSLAIALLRQLLQLPGMGVEARLAEISPYHVSEAARLLPELAPHRPTPEAEPMVDPELARIRLFDAVSAIVQRCVESGPVEMIAIDDIHWADDASLQLLSYVMRSLEELPLLLLVSWTPGRSHAYPPSQLWPQPPSPDSQTITLQRLTREEVVELLAESGAGPLAARLYRETEGVPLFINEYLQLIRAQERDEEEVWTLPGGVRDVLRFRLSTIDDLDRQLLATAAVIGRSFTFGLLQAASGRSEEEIVSSLESLLRQGLITEWQSPERAGDPTLYDFYHNKLRTLLYEELSFARRRLLHRRVAERLSDSLRQEVAPGTLGQIAHHYREARADELAADFYFRAGQRAQRLYAHREARAYYEQALALGHPAYGTILLGTGEAYLFEGRYGDALLSFEAAAARSEGLLKARVEYRIAQVNHRLGEWDIAREHYEMALGTARKQDPALAAQILADWSLTAYRRSQAEQARQLAEESLRYATDSGEQRALARAYNILGILARGAGKTRQARSHLEQSLGLAEELGLAGVRLAALNNLASVHLEAGDQLQALQLAERAITQAEQYGDRHLQAALHSNLADILFQLGRVTDSQRHQEASVRILVEIDAAMPTTRPEIWKMVEW